VCRLPGSMQTQFSSLHIRHYSLTFFVQADKIEKLEKDHGWNEEQFDFILQFLRTILLKRELFPTFMPRET
jgi:hypothetical protein